MWIYFPIVLLLLTEACILARTLASSPTNFGANTAELIKYLQNEQAGVSAAQQRIVEYLHSKKISIGSEPVDPSVLSKSSESLIKDRLAVSTDEHPIECRVTLDQAPTGSICVAPCGCSGSQKWVQFSVLNKLRRKEPKQWVTCQTCRQPFVYDLFLSHADLKANILGLILDKIEFLRFVMFLSVVLVGYILSLPALLQRVLISRSVWQLVSLLLSTFYCINPNNVNLCYYSIHIGQS
jgi:hypothetical protein